MEPTSDKPRSVRIRPPLWCALAILVGLISISSSVGCGEGDQAPIRPVESTECQTPVRPVQLMGSAGRYTPEVTMSVEAQHFSPPAEMALYRITPTQPVTEEAKDALTARLILAQNEASGEEDPSGPVGNLSFPRQDDADCFRMEMLWVSDAAFGAILAGQPPQPMSHEETGVIADRYLGFLGMLDDYTFLGTREGCAYGTATPSGEEEYWVVEMLADYQAFIGGVPLVGTGSKVQVGVAANGTVDEFCHFAQAATACKENVAIRPVTAALDDLEQGRGEVPPSINEKRGRSVTVESVDLWYYAPPPGPEVTYYKPVYVFHVRMADGTLGDWLLSAFEGSTAEGAL